MNPKPDSVDQYLSWFSGEIRERLELIRATLKNELPEAKEVISYHMPAFKTSEVLVFYAAAKSHIGFYPTNTGVENFKDELKGYFTSKGAIQFPYDRDLPLELIIEIALFRAEEAKLRADKRKKR